MQILEPRLRAVSCFVVAYFAIGLVLAFNHLNYEFLYYGLVMVAIIQLILLMDARVKFSPLVLWGMAIWGLLHFSGGVLPIPESLTEPGRPPNLYNMRVAPWFPKFDQIVHAFGFGVSAMLIYEALCAHIKKRLAITLPLASVLYLSAIGLGAMNEVIEFIAVELMPHTNVGGYKNTGWDLVSNAVGAAVAIGILYLRKQRSKA